MKFRKKYLLMSLKFIIFCVVCMTFDYIFLKVLATYLEDKELINYYSSAINTIIMAIIPIFVLYVQIKTNHNQFAYSQKKNEISYIINLSIKYLNMYNFEVLKQLLFDWQYSYKSPKNCRKELKRITDEAAITWLQFSFQINTDDNISKTFLSNQSTNYNLLCCIFEELRTLFCHSYSDLRDSKSNSYKRLAESGSRLIYCLNEKLLVKAIFEDYDISYSKVKDEINSYINTLKSDLNNTLKIYG